MISVPRPRQILPGQFYLITRRCTQRQFLLRPDFATNNAFLYCLAYTAERCKIDVLLTVVESNHHHTVIFDRHGRCPEFIEQLHKLVARSQNALRGRWENFWAAEEPCVTRLVDRAAVIDKLVYTATNPVKDGLVQRVHHWPGANGYPSFIAGRSIRATRPRHFFRNPGPMPELVELRLAVPPELGDTSEILKLVRRDVEAVERHVAQQRAKTGLRVIGRRRIIAQSWKASPASVEPRRGLRPRFAGGVEQRVAAIAEYQEFLTFYRVARKRWLAGLQAIFPRGTYWLSRFAAVQLTPSPA